MSAPDLTLTRYAYTSTGTYGQLTTQGLLLWTVERPWQDNQPWISCIPLGSYPLRWVDSPRFGGSWEVAEVPGRTHILLHAANKPGDLAGCVGVGMRPGDGRVYDSRDAMTILNESLRLGRIRITQDPFLFAPSSISSPVARVG